MLRLIPAHAGKTAGIGLVEDAEAGSSPLTRGKLQALDPDVLREGLIPAHTGKTCSGRRKQPRTRAHPCSRGENMLTRCSGVCAYGSSPLTRGKRDVGGVRSGRRGLIPAHAGRTGKDSESE